MSWWDKRWDYRHKIRLDGGSLAAALTNHPVAITVDPSWFTYDNCLADGSDIRFIDTNGTTQLEHYVESWNVAGTSTLWVYVPTVSTNNFDHVMMYYGGPQTRTNASYSSTTAPYYCVNGHVRENDDVLVGEYLCTDTTPILTSLIEDSVGGTDATVFTGDATVTTVDGRTGIDFYNAGVDAYAAGTGVEHFAFPLAVSAWVYPTEQYTAQIVARVGVGGGGGWTLMSDASGATGSYFKFSHTDYVGAAPVVQTAITYDSNEWHYVVGIINSSTISIYVDGVLDNYNSVGAPYVAMTSYNYGYYTWLSRTRGGLVAFRGPISDVKIWKYAPSVAEIKREYDTYAAALDTVTYDILPEERKWYRD